MKIKSPICGAYLDTKGGTDCLPFTGLDVRAMCGQVNLDLDNGCGDMREFGPGVWTYLTPDEARQLAAHLFREARAASKHDEATCPSCIQERKFRAAGSVAGSRHG